METFNNPEDEAIHLKCRMEFRLSTSRRKQKKIRNFFGKQIFINGERCDVSLFKGLLSRRWSLMIKSRERFVIIVEEYDSFDFAKIVYDYI